MVGDIEANLGGGVKRAMTSGTRRPDPLIGTLVHERYRILELIGRGGMGVVYRAEHELMERIVAIKMLLPQLLADENALPRFQREARAASRLNHPNIIALHDFGLTEDGLPYLVMDYIDGKSLADILKNEGQLGVQRTAHIFTQVCDALAHAHELGIIHRDLKPGNIMIVQKKDEKESIKVVDFGVAKMFEGEDEIDSQRLTATGELFGSPVYMSPEQCQGLELTPRSDIYSLGCVIYETLTGKLPHCGRTVLETISRQMQSPAQPFAEARPDLYIPDWLEKAVFEALEKDIEKRPPDMRALQNALALGTFNNSTSQMRAIPGNSSRQATIAPTALTSRAAIKTVDRTNAAAPAESGQMMPWVITAIAVVALAISTSCVYSMWCQSQKAQAAIQAVVATPAVQQGSPVTVEPQAKDIAPKPITPDTSAPNRLLRAPTKPPKKPTRPSIQTSQSRTVSPTQYTAPVQKVSPVRHRSKPRHLPTSTSGRKADYYDYVKHYHNYGDPQALPVKPYTGE